MAARPGVRRFHLLYANASRLGRSLHVDDVYEGFEHYLHLHVAELARRRLFVHAPRVLSAPAPTPIELTAAVC